MISCLYCDKPVTTSKNIKYCTNICQQKQQYSDNIEKWLKGGDPGWKGKTRQLKEFVRKYLYELYGEGCQICGWCELHPIDNRRLTEVDHKDGDAENCKLENLRILCPNCHAKTPTHRARNKNSKRDRS